MRYLISFIAIIPLFFCSHLAYSNDKTIVLGSYFIPGLVENSEEGLFVDFFNEIKSRSGLDLSLLIKPTARVQAEFKKGALVGYFPELHESLPLPLDQVLVSESFWTKPIHIFYRSNEPEINRVEQLHGKRIALVRGYTYGREITQSPKIIRFYVESDLQTLKMLDQGRVDYVLGDSHSTAQTLGQLGLGSKIIFDRDRPLYELDVFFVFQKTEQGKKIQVEVSRAIREMKEAGTLKF